MEQPVHTVYGGAQLFRWDIKAKIGRHARDHFIQVAPTAQGLQEVFPHLSPALAETLWKRVLAKLGGDLAVEDYRVDFEDGLGQRRWDEEDELAEYVGSELARGVAEGSLPASVGIRIKSLGAETRKRAMATLKRCLGAFGKHRVGLPPHFVITLPKVEDRKEVAALVAALQAVERQGKYPRGALRVEIMVESPRALQHGGAALAPLLAAAKGRCRGVHFGAYDYLSSFEICADAQTLEHPICQHARMLILHGAFGSAVWLADGAVTRMPVPLFREPKSDEERRANVEAIREAWRMSYASVRRAAAQGFFQGWDLHPGQIPVRYLAIYAHYLEGLSLMSARLEHFLANAARATLHGNTFDDAATLRGIVHYFLRGISCGALSESDLEGLGVDMATLREAVNSRNFELRPDKRHPKAGPTAGL